MDYAEVIRVAEDFASAEVCQDDDYKDWAGLLYRRVRAVCIRNCIQYNGIPDGESCPRAFLRWVEAHR